MTKDYMLKPGTVSMKEAESTAETQPASTVAGSLVAPSPSSLTEQVRAGMDAVAKSYGKAAHRVLQKRYAIK